MELLQGTHQIAHTLHMEMVTTVIQPGCVSWRCASFGHALVLKNVLVLERCYLEDDHLQYEA